MCDYCKLNPCECNKIKYQFNIFTELFASDAYQFLNMKQFLIDIELKPNKTTHEILMLESFAHVAKLCKYFIDKNPPI